MTGQPLGAQANPDESRRVRALRLLDLYAVAKLQMHFGVSGTKEETVAKIVEDHDWDAISEFARLYHPTTKHFLHVFSHAGIYTPGKLLPDPLGETAALEYSDISSAVSRWFYLFALHFQVYLRKPPGEEIFEFPWPISIELNREMLSVRFTKMAKSMAARMPKERIVKVQQETTDTTLLAQIVGNMGLEEVRPADLTKGLKALWADDVIDALKVQFKKPRSTATNAMDSEFLLKRDDPELYQEIVSQPIYDTVFRWLDDPIGLTHFKINPESGTFGFGTFSDLGEGAGHVVDEILRRNR